MKLKVGLELSCLTGKYPTGIARYSSCLGENIKKNPNVELTGLFPASRFLKIKNIDQYPWLRKKFFYGGMLDLFREKLDIVHTTDFKIPRVKNKLVSTVHDIFLFKDEGRRFATKEFREKKKLELENIIQNADHLITVSQKTKEDLCDFFNYSPDRISVTHLGLSESLFTTPVDDNSNNQMKRPFFLFVGAISDRKNVNLLMKAFSQTSELKDFDLVLAGHMSTGSEEIVKLREKLKMTDRIQFLSHVSDENLIRLYDQSSGLVFPTHYEGFGIPPLEAMLRKKPVLVGNKGATREVLGSEVLYCEPTELESIKEGLVKILSFKKDWIQSNYTHAKSFTWDKTAEKTISVYEKTIGR